jgi:hypothetical protein
MLAMALNSVGVEPEPTTLERVAGDTATATVRQTLVSRRRRRGLVLDEL